MAAALRPSLSDQGLEVFLTAYQPLADYLAACTADHVNLTFAGVEKILGRRLPPSARTRRVWWANDTSSPGRCCASWLGVGWRVDTVDMDRELVAFSKVGPPRMPLRRPEDLRHAPIEPPTRAGEPNASQEWFWEGNVQDRTVGFLRAEGWTIERQADTATHEHGVDILAAKGGRRLAVEVKGYPPSVYTFGANKGMPKPAPQARLQAQAFFAQALLTTILTRSKLPDAELSLALPNHPVYNQLLQDAEWAMNRLGIGAYIVTAEGCIRKILSH